jgi:adhesin/invasin
MVKEPVRVTRVSFGILVASVAMVAVACGSDSNETPLVATSIAANSGSSGQTGPAGQALANPISVHVTDQDGNAFSGATVTWSVVGGGGSVDAATSLSDASGNATVHWTLGAAAGVDSLTASLANGQVVTITATATAAATNVLLKVSGDSQSVKVATATAPLVVKLTNGGTAVSGATIAWTVTGGGTLSAASTTTDATGTASVTLTTAATAGTMTVTASGPSNTSVTFTVTGTP